VSDELRKLADAVLYEGYVLWPYRRSAPKNQQRWTWGGVFPPRHTEAHPDDRAAIQAQCLVEADDEPEVDARVRFLQVVERGLRDASGAAVPELVAGGELYLAWDEAVEREVVPGPIRIDSGSEREAVVGGQIVRSWEALRGSVDVEVERCAEQLFRVTVRVANETPWRGRGRDDALRHTLCSTHVVLHTKDGAFVSLTDPPEDLRIAAARCVNVGVWPVLVGAQGDRHTLFASPIILSDYPQIAPESPGDLFDAGEIDRLLILNVLSLTEAEQEEMRATDPRTRVILERCAALGAEALAPLHGTFREAGS
jgi:hydrogenase maturation protease